MKSLYQRRTDQNALGEIQQNQQNQIPYRMSPMTRDGRPPQQQAPSTDPRGRSPTKNAFTTLTKAMANGGKSRDVSPTKPKKTKSGTNLAGLLTRPKSIRGLQKLLVDEETRQTKDKENRSPADPNHSDGSFVATPIYSQFCRDAVPGTPGSTYGTQQSENMDKKQRPRSFHPNFTSNNASSDRIVPMNSPTKTSGKTSSWERSPTKPSRPRLNTAFGHSRSKSSDATLAEPHIDPQDIDSHLEAMLNRRNIPENQRYKMRNLNNTIKMEFIRQDWAEMQAAKGENTRPVEKEASPEAGSAVTPGYDQEEAKPKRTRGKSFTLARGSKHSGSSGKKSRVEGTLGRHFRTKSTESIISSDRPLSGISTSSGSGLLSKIKLGQGPGDFVSYLRKVTKPELVEVGKLHKLRLLLRNETVTWTEDFIQQGGMKEIVDLLNRIMEVEWREEHEDALLHETLLCLKALCTTALALQYLHSIQASLFPKLLHMLFDPEKKGPSEFTTRNIIISILFTYIESATGHERISRAKTVLDHLRDPQPPEDERPVPFVLEMRRERPYRVWCKEVTNVTKEVFWIFLHHLNVIALNKPDETQASSPHSTRFDSASADLAYMARHFPQERPPVPAAPYVGGVEWDATNYLASHLDLMNAIISCTPTADGRNALRAELRISGWERCLGGSLRLCKEKFYGAVHEALRTWVAAAAEDTWDVRDVRFGPPPDQLRSPVKSTGGMKKKIEPPPKIEMPKLSLELEGGSSRAAPLVGRDDGTSWLS
ncbi:hypothetical protein jhhlp_003249 [Lomentospora prolificans]|uniref:Formin GTPase-binding domain-containing protein n=1 Tax=Lomentospora prolificans TaxID=41688 RepID=A0A2N3NGD2_9PEZI|nr:hypothetical protein jhhlp_003249 [Lomentospora prolificans]